jgi:hypothetical protein
MRSRFVRVLIVLSLVLGAQFALAPSAGAISVCYYGSERLSGNYITPAAGTGRFTAGVHWYIGYSCSGMPVAIRVTSVAWRIYFPAGGLDWVVHTMTDMGIKVDPNSTALAVYSDHTQRSCTGACTIQHTWTLNVVGTYGTKWATGVGCWNCGLAGGNIGITMVYNFEANTFEWGDTHASDKW